MNTKIFIRTGIILFILLGTISLAYASSDNYNGYIVTPSTGQYTKDEIVDSKGADKNITFWNLPLWVQLSIIGGATFSTFAFIKYIPLLLGKIATKKNNPKQEEIVSYIIKNPGCLESEIAKGMKLNRGTLRYYIANIASNKRIHTIKKGRIKAIFHISHNQTKKEQLLMIHKRNDTRKKLIQIIASNPGVTRQELSTYLNIDSSTVHWHIKSLYNDRMIDTKKDGRTTMYFPQTPILIDNNKDM